MISAPPAPTTITGAATSAFSSSSSSGAILLLLPRPSSPPPAPSSLFFFPKDSLCESGDDCESFFAAFALHSSCLAKMASSMSKMLISPKGRTNFCHSARAPAKMPMYPAIAPMNASNPLSDSIGVSRKRTEEWSISKINRTLHFDFMVWSAVPYEMSSACTELTHRSSVTDPSHLCSKYTGDTLHTILIWIARCGRSAIRPSSALVRARSPVSMSMRCFSSDLYSFSSFSSSPAPGQNSGSVPSSTSLVFSRSTESRMRGRNMGALAGIPCAHPVTAFVHLAFPLASGSAAQRRTCPST
mmetsp:Transcript_17539/g.43742  ORF Transcript_17539/g.43742 Transcript_17539/m.43742 type:complete len:300 (-) Transcript_17539:9719-10618(-)